MRILARALVLWALLISVKLVYLQIFRHDELRRMAQQQQEKMVEIEAPRGTIFDRTGQPLAMSLPVDSVCVNPLRVPDLAVAAGILAGVLNLDENELLGKMKYAASNQRGFLWVKRKISPEESARVRSLKLDWIEFRTETRRFYPNGPLAAHVLGGVDHDENGNAGVERSMNSELAGHPGYMRVTKDVKQNPFDAQIAVQPKPGKDITLTIDSRIQYVMERELKAAVEGHHAQTGSAVAMDPRNGEILALASYPAFDPNDAVKPGESLADRTNLAVSTPFEPGSVFKVVTLSAALETTNLTPATMIPCGGGSIRLFGRVIHDAENHGNFSFADVLAHSSNIGAIEIGLKVGAPAMYEYIRRFGFGQHTGIPLPGESTGLLRRLPHWTKTSIASVAMGQEVSATTVQLAQACTIVADGGVLLRPRLILKPGRSGGTDASEDSPVRVLKPETAITMRQMMEGVVLHGTGRNARLEGYTSGGKTGSAQIFDTTIHQYTHHYNGSFMGFAPVTNPRIVVVVSLNHTPTGSAGFGAQVAAPAFRQIAMSGLRIIGVPKDVPDGAPEPDETPAVYNDLAIASLSDHPGVEPADDVVSSVTPPLVQTSVAASAVAGDLDQRPFFVGPKVPNFQGKTMRAVMEESGQIGMPVEVVGSGIARSQAPPAGSMLAPGAQVVVQFAR
ncbi:MAG: penicillin-binding protein [Bryobacteraceae bacterium]